MNSELHIGNIIKTDMHNQGRRAAWLAQRLHCDKSNIYKIYSRKNIDIQLLTKISKELDKDYFKIISDYYFNKT